MASDFGVYVHWPYCARICPYCDFNVYKDRGVDAARWSAALARDLEHWAAKTEGRSLTSLYFGGGTPSLAPPSVIADVIAACGRLWGFAADAEITLEANPTDAELDRFQGLRAAGVNRLSLGVQSFDDAALKFLGRDHDGAAGLRAIGQALEAFPRVSADFIYARPGQTDDQWTDELTRAFETGLRHLSLYQLTIEQGTAFGRAVARKAWTPVDEDRGADLFDLTQDLTAAAGLPAYEVSNHSVPGDESRHNFLYWRQDDYAGVGPGAHGRLTLQGRRYETVTERAPERYLSLVESNGSGAVVNDPLTDEAAMTERLAMGLRTTEGVTLKTAGWDRLASKAEPLFVDGLLERRGERLIATASGRRVLNAVLGSLL